MSTELMFSIVKKQTALGIASNPKKAEIQSNGNLSAKAQKAKQAIEEGDFGCQKQSVAALVSAMLEEEITISNDDDEDENAFDVGKALKVPRFALLVCIHERDDEKGNTIEEDSVVLRAQSDLDSDSIYGTTASELLRQEVSWMGISKKGVADYSFEEINENEFRFATDEEIEKFVSRFPLSAIKYWFADIIIALS